MLDALEEELLVNNVAVLLCLLRQSPDMSQVEEPSTNGNLVQPHKLV